MRSQAESLNQLHKLALTEIGEGAKLFPLSESLWSCRKCFRVYMAEEKKNKLIFPFGCF